MKIFAAILVAVYAWALAENYLARRAAAVDIDMKPAACYEVAGEVLKNDTHYAVIFNKCEPGFRWLKVPPPPDHEV